MSTDVVVAGVAMTRQGRLDLSISDMVRDAAVRALADAGVSAGEIGAVVFSNSMGGDLLDQGMIRGQTWLRGLPLDGTPVFNVEGACAGGAMAMSLATTHVRGSGDLVLVVGGERMWTGDRLTTLAAIEQGFAFDEREGCHDRLENKAGSIAMGMNAEWAAHQVDERGATVEHFAAAAAKAYLHGSMNPDAQHRRAWSVEDILASPTIAGTLTRLMCSSFTDGAAAAVLAPAGKAAGPTVRASVVVSGDGSGEYHGRLAQAAEKVWAASGVGPGDLDVVELHDPTGAEEIWAVEAIGLYPVGGGGPATVAGDTTIGGRGPVVNPSGGLVGRGHPIGATGICQVVELVGHLREVRGPRQVEGARLAGAFNTGGVLGADTAVVGATVLEA
jgi:acetyl-CoA acetyltransferase